MSRTNLRIVIILAALSIAGVAITQTYWVRRAFDLRENQFNRDVSAALRTVAERVFVINKTPSPANNPVDQLSTNSFVVHINGPIDDRLLKFLLATEFEKRNISATYEYCIYDCIGKCVANGNIAGLQQTPARLKASDGYYFAIQFPRVEANLISQMGIWGFSSIVMLLVVSFFIYALFVILRQRKLSEIQKDFINNMTHEFKTPLSTIAISSAVLKDPDIASNPARLLNYAGIIETESSRLTSHVERVLQVASLEQKGFGLTKEVTDMHSLIQNVVGLVEISLHSFGGKIHLNLTAEKFTIPADKMHLTNVIFNLLDNAIKYTTKAPMITVSTRNVKDGLLLSVEDNGVGISASNQKKVFDRFFRVPTGNKHDVKGFGLGLHYVSRIVRAHKGKPALTSVPEKGSVFMITLPLA